GGHDATEGMELQARKAVRTHQGRATGAGTKRGHCRGDCRSDREQGTGSVGRGQGEFQAFPKGYLIWPAWRASVTPRVWWAHPRSALRRGQGPRDQGPLEDDQGSAPGRSQPEDRPQGLL